METVVLITVVMESAQLLELELLAQAMSNVQLVCVVAVVNVVMELVKKATMMLVIVVAVISLLDFVDITMVKHLLIIKSIFV